MPQRSWREAKVSDRQILVRLSQEQLDWLRANAENHYGKKIPSNAAVLRYCLSLLDADSFALTD